MKILVLNGSPRPKGNTDVGLIHCVDEAAERAALYRDCEQMGVRNMADLKIALQYMTATVEEKEYSVIGEFTPQNAQGICVYCNHCQPCPMGLDVGLMNKYYDLALAGDEMAKEHYWKLPVHADACIRCGHCEARCPFHVKQEDRLKEINFYFQKEETNNVR